MGEREVGSVLVVDDDAGLRKVLERGLGALGFRVRSVEDLADVEPLLREEDFDVVVTDLNLRRGTGLEVTKAVLDLRPGIPVIVITAYGSLETAVDAIRAGAFDFLTKPFDLQVVAIAIERAVRFRRINDDVKRLRALAKEGSRVHDLVGRSAAMARVYDLLERVRESDVSVLVTGESGTGKELVARALHGMGRRATGPFVAINCAALPEPLLESELFGHVRGAFTDAKTSRSGLFVQASGGTLFLDEVGDLPAGMQPKLLRALQDRVVRPVGGDREIPFDARIIAATNRDLVSAVEAGRFREDLYFRLNVLEIEIPPLRLRGNDVLLLAQHFLERAAAAEGKPVRSIAPEAAKKLLAYRWPGNVRELQNCIERAVALCRLDAVTPDDLPDRVRDFAPTRITPMGDDVEQLVSLEEVERRYILRVLEAVNGHRGHASRILKLDRKTLYRKLEAWGHAKDASTTGLGS